MTRKLTISTIVTLAAIGLSLGACSSGSKHRAQEGKKGMKMPFGTPQDIQYSKKLWKALEKVHFVGSGTIETIPYKGQHPHGAVLETLKGQLKLGGNTGEVIVKKNYGGKDISNSKVANNRKKYLKAVTVMYKRDGYDPDNANWFWVKYKPNGGLHKNPKGMQLAGRVAKGMSKGCIACHKAAPGGDYIFTNTSMQLDK